MHIIGGNDYYDCMLAYGRDDLIHFVRDGRRMSRLDDSRHSPGGQEDNILRSALSNQQFAMRNPDGSAIPSNTSYSSRTYVISSSLRVVLSEFIVLLAGIEFYGMQVQKDERGPSILRTTEAIVWSDAALSKFIGRDVVTHASSSFLYPDKTTYFRRRNLDPRGAVFDYMLKHGIVVAHPALVKIVDLTVSRDEIVINGCELGRTGFASIVPPDECYRLIYDWISGVLTTAANRMITITDSKILMTKHGMDETSFRKPKSKKRVRSS